MHRGSTVGAYSDHGVGVDGETRADWGERLIALLFLVASLPLVLVLALVVRLGDPGPVLYRGTRLGLRKKPFTMLKLRTLRSGASQVTGAELLNHTHDLTIPGGRFLRETRLDELPQLWNVLRGDMSFVGPRPERPEVYEAKCREIPGYELRFDVRPGLIGVSQLFTPHGTPKRYRALIDNSIVRTRRLGAWLVPFTALVVIAKSLRRTLEQFWSALVLRRLLRRFQEKRRLRRTEPRGALAFLSCPGLVRRPYRVLDMNEHALLLECDVEPEQDLGNEFVLEIPVDRGGTLPARRHARCQGYVTQRRRGPGVTRIVLQYRPYTPRSEYMIHQYFLRTSLAAPRPPWNGRVPTPIVPSAPLAPRRADPISVG